jgi:hypothetical protein
MLFLISWVIRRGSEAFSFSMVGLGKLMIILLIGFVFFYESLLRLKKVAIKQGQIPLHPPVKRG